MPSMFAGSISSTNPNPPPSLGSFNNPLAASTATSSSFGPKEGAGENKLAFGIFNQPPQNQPFSVNPTKVSIFNEEKKEPPKA
mmetsp:Transcript_3619/g.3571  ORF Transcript_3619/g.3571 Transcript_3619/m.3571 type:complete len:83 (-) Transcript_3619:1-249(-)